MSFSFVKNIEQFQIYIA